MKPDRPPILCSKPTTPYSNHFDQKTFSIHPFLFNANDYIVYFFLSCDYWTLWILQNGVEGLPRTPSRLAMTWIFFSCVLCKDVKWAHCASFLPENEIKKPDDRVTAVREWPRGPTMAVTRAHSFSLLPCRARVTHFHFSQEMFSQTKKEAKNKKQNTHRNRGV